MSYRNTARAYAVTGGFSSDAFQQSKPQKAKFGYPIALSHTALPPLFVALDVLIILICALGSDVIYHSFVVEGPGDLQRALGAGTVAAVIFTALQHARKLYSGIRGVRLLDHLKAAVMCWLTVFAGLSCILFLLKMGDAFSRGVLVIFFASGLIGLLVWRIVLKRLYRKLVIAGTVAGPRVAVLAESGRSDIDGLLLRLERYGYSLSRLFFLPQEGSQPGAVAKRKATVLRALIRHIREQKVDEILVVASWNHFVAGDAQSLQAALRIVPVPVKFLADADLAKAMSYEVCDVGAAKAIVLKPSALSRLQRVRKRLLDITTSAFLLVCFLPVMVIIALLIRVETEGPIFFRQWRGGYNGRRFRIFKFRTMHVQEDGAIIRQARRGDPRVTTIGRFLRRTSLDELPQLINVLLGDMSLVGPRPHAVAHDITYAELIEPYPARHNVKPGITGWAQVNGCRGETADVALMQKRIDHDLSYIERWSLLFDVRIMLLTAREVLMPRNAH
jgi:Undecaprenyl-phosphate glucose phosphotransferase